MRVLWCWGGGSSGPSSTDEYQLLFARRWPAVERRARVVHGKHYTAPPDADTVLSTFTSASCTSGSEHVTNVDELDSADPAQIELLQLTEPPLFVVDGCWPLVVLQRDNYVAGCLPFVETPPTPTDKSTALLQSPDVSSSLSFLEELLTLLSRLEGQSAAVVQSELSMFSSLACPTGVYDGLSYPHVTTLLTKGTDTSPVVMPAWRVGSHAEARPSLEFFITETVTASQQHPVDYYESMVVSGVVSCRAALAGKPEITATISSGTDLTRCHVHHCVQQSRSGGNSTQRTVTFIPPIERFDLLQYKVTLAAEPLQPPLLGSYEMTSRGDQSRVSFTLTLRRSDRYTGPPLESVEVVLPFFNRGCVSGQSLRPTAGTASAMRGSHVVVWRLDKHFSGKQVAASLQGELRFDVTARHQGMDDPFCTNVTSYADVRWVAQGKTLSNTFVNTDTVRIQPPLARGKVKAVVTSTLKSGDYRIWNVHGSSRQCIPPSPDREQNP
ncbi:hypothetical protein PTSG_00227 [Salpingoeca rosetta]|uniref:MHD domain-containing protein n=1 Tax=Salpingoeca rosetta (strain ATCC 50818 / BSB-021) TaxID=946362 RepID=F2TVW0_SALR5|nr:uncharacterized protein PTSG_00227 [Salpingoeca rosetta]EGD72206.1 hypothetical protein PTSG_00227 [Salpingoeca rosetta]|eukprot:XP_004998777.1 hypothetical protein PTSG_00227 [Salpingoeca rosetta]